MGALVEAKGGALAYAGVGSIEILHGPRKILSIGSRRRAKHLPAANSNDDDARWRTMDTRQRSPTNMFSANEKSKKITKLTSRTRRTRLRDSLSLILSEAMTGRDR